MKQRIHKTVLSLRLLKLFLGSILLGLYIAGCGNEKSKTPDKKCYKPPNSVVNEMQARDDSISKADSMNKADSIKKQSPPERPTCYIKPGPVKKKK